MNEQPKDLRALAERTLPFLRDEAAKYEDDGSNEPLELARDIEAVIAEHGAMVPALDVFRIAGGDVECEPNPTAESAMTCLRDLRERYDERITEHGGGVAWQPIETAPKDGTDVLVLLNVATVDVVHIAWWREPDPDLDETAEDRGWWSYVRGSVTQEQLDGYRSPTHWMPLPAAPTPEQRG